MVRLLKTIHEMRLSPEEYQLVCERNTHALVHAAVNRVQTKMKAEKLAKLK